MVDLNGYSIIFDDSPVVSASIDEIGEFENASVALAALRIDANDTVTGLRSLRCVSVSANGSVHGSGALRIEASCSAQITFPTLVLSANTAYQIDYVVFPVFSATVASFELRNAQSSVVVGTTTVPADSGSASQRRSGYVEISEGGVYELLLRVRTSGTTGAVNFDSIDVTHGASYGVLVNPLGYHAGGMWNRLDPLAGMTSSTDSVRNFTLRNGSLRQGSQRALGSRGIHLLGIGVTVQNVSIYMSGRDTEAVGGQCSNVRLEGSLFQFADAVDAKGKSLDGFGIVCIDACRVSMVNNTLVGRGIFVGGYASRAVKSSSMATS